VLSQKNWRKNLSGNIAHFLVHVKIFTHLGRNLSMPIETVHI